MLKNIVSKEGPIGRDSMPVFKNWSKKQTLIERVAKTTSDIFGPAGDHLGVRDKWEAHCSRNGTRSFIGNYKDNRFNALFQTSAEILFHRKDFIKVINHVSNKNLKIKAVLADLQSDCVQQMLKALCLIYVTITGPYWWLITSGTVPCLELAPVIKQLESFLQTCTTQPELLVRQEINW
ncbi:hypothetical protein DPMN_051463 [Dreissena polymorpha]|uniref:Uncharacterized protein n=1 Tax=Dreissena polymorpha TaxID=45954 RepID=A0A9D4CK07_DREPO|nr:hypothetical protein DPMN_051463 [Dreissena polymorpha]